MKSSSIVAYSTLTFSLLLVVLVAPLSAVAEPYWKIASFEEKEKIRRGEAEYLPTEEELSTEMMVAGKLWTVKPGEEAGTFDCQWGDEKVVWRPKPWHPADYKKIGPNIFKRWIAPGLPYPWEVPLEKRVDTFKGAEVHDRSYTALYFNEFGESYITDWNIDLMSADGVERNKTLHEWMIAYRINQEGLPKGLVGKVRARYMFTFVAPNDFRGLGITTTVYFGEKFNDEFLYTPAARRVRRLPMAARQDIIPGSIVRWEDFPQNKPFPDIDYTRKGFELYKGVPNNVFGMREGDDRIHGEIVNEGIDGVCEPSYVLEIVPKNKGYWYGRQRRVIGILTGSSWWEEAFNWSGEVFRERVNRRSMAYLDPRLQNPYKELEAWQMIWGGEHFYEPLSGFQMSWYMNKFYINLHDLPRDLVGVDNLSKEPVRKILFWR